MTIQILGTGCPKCKQLAENAALAVAAAGVACHIEKVTQIAEIMKFGVMLTPALALDGVVKCMGKVLTVAIADPLNLLAIDDLKMVTRYQIDIALATENDIRDYGFSGVVAKPYTIAELRKAVQDVIG